VVSEEYLKSTEFSTGLGPVAKNATSHGENSGSPKELKHLFH